MMEYLSEYFLQRGIRLFAPIPLSACRVTRSYLLERAEIAPTEGTAVMLAIPYFTKAAASPERNLSAYAVPRDYHLFFRDLFDDLLPRLRAEFPEDRFAGFADHSPIDERDAAARAGLGIIGQNGMLITEPYSSYVFPRRTHHHTKHSLPAAEHPGLRGLRHLPTRLPDDGDRKLPLGAHPKEGRTDRTRGCSHPALWQRLGLRHLRRGLPAYAPRPGERDHL